MVGLSGPLAVHQVHIPSERKRTMLRSQRRRMSMRGLAAAPGVGPVLHTVLLSTSASGKADSDL